MDTPTKQQQTALNDMAKAIYQAKDAATAKRKLAMPTMDPDGVFDKNNWGLKTSLPVEFVFNHKTHKGFLRVEIKKEIVFVEDENA